MSIGAGTADRGGIPTEALEHIAALYRIEAEIRGLARPSAVRTDSAAENWVAVASLIKTCKLNAVDPQRYLAQTLIRLVNGRQNSRIDDLMPWAQASRHLA